MKTSWALLPAVVLLLASCANPSGTSKRAPLTEEACPSPTFGPYTYGSDTLPRAVLPKDPSTWASLPMPLPLEGGDNGDMSTAYSALAMGYYTLRVQKPPTCMDEERTSMPCYPFQYEYDPRTNTNGDTEMIHRQLVGALSLTWMYRISGRPEFKLAATSALNTIMLRAKVDRDGHVKIQDLGASSLSAMAMSHLAVLTGDRSMDTQIRGLGEFLLSKIADDGRVTMGSVLQWQQLHNALWRLWEYTEDPRYIDALKRVARFAYEHRDERGKKQYFQYPYLYGLWAHEPLTELYRVMPEEKWIPELVFEVADEVAKKQYTRENTSHCDWVGGYKPNNGRGHPNWNHTLKLEATIDAWRMAVLVGDAERVERYRKSAEAGAAFMMHFQHRAADNSGYAGAERAFGGVPLFGDNPRVRIDIPGHGGVAMCKVVEYFGVETVPGAPEPLPSPPPASDAVEVEAPTPDNPTPDKAPAKVGLPI